MFNVTVRITGAGAPRSVAATFDPVAITSIGLLREWAAAVAEAPESEMGAIATRDADEDDAVALPLLKDKRLKNIEAGCVVLVVLSDSTSPAPSAACGPVDQDALPEEEQNWMRVVRFFIQEPCIVPQLLQKARLPSPSAIAWLPMSVGTLRPAELPHWCALGAASPPGHI